MTIRQSSAWARTAIAVALLVACSGPSTVSKNIAVVSSDHSSGDSGDHSGSSNVRAVVWVDEETICSQECDWVEGTPWTDASKSLARRVQTSLYMDFVRTVTTYPPIVSECAPNLVRRLQQMPRLLVYVKGDVPEEVLAERRVNFQRVSDEEFEREKRNRESSVAVLEISVDEPTQLAGTTEVGISYFCNNRTPADGRQGRGGVAVERDGSILVTMDGGYDE